MSRGLYAVSSLWHFDIDEASVGEFISGDPVRLGFFIVNRSMILLDEERRQGRDLTVDWSDIAQWL